MDLVPGRVVLAGTPIGDVADASPSLVAALLSADIVAAEDTRRLRALADRLGISVNGKIVSYFDGNEADRAAELASKVAEGATVVVVTDAGMPCVSDPGFRLVQLAAQQGLTVTAVPGPSAALTALAVSGFASDRFCFEGFAPRKSTERARYLAELAQESRTMIFFEAPHRTAEFLGAAVEAFGADRPAVVCRELTKTYEEIRRGSLASLVEWAGDGVRGEVTIVIAGAAPHVGTLPEALQAVQEFVAQGEKLSKAVSRASAQLGVDRHELYDAALAAKKGRA